MNERDEGVVRMDAQLWGLVAEMWADIACIEAMKAANKEREMRGESLAYPEESFREIIGGLNYISNTLRGM